MKPFDYQLEAVEFIKKEKRVYGALDMGMGKTITALLGGVECPRPPGARRNVLLIAEKNEIVNSENFRREVEAHFSESFWYANLRDTPLEEIKDSVLPAVCGINPDALIKLDPMYVRALFDYAIVDEATMAKTTTTARFKNVKKILDDMTYVVLLSGMPMLNGAAELFAPLLLLNHKLAGDGTVKAREAFETIFAGGHKRRIRNTGIWYQDYVWWAKGANHVRELRYLIRDKFFFKQKGDTDIFKKKTRTVQPVPMSLEWVAEYQQAWGKYFGEAQWEHRGLSSKKYDKKMENITELQKLIENGQMYQVNSKWKARQAVEDIKSGKFGEQRIVVFSMFKETDELIGELLTAAGVTWRTFEDVQEWKRGHEQVIVGRIKAHGKGGNVPEASVCLFVDMDFVPANNIQAENRIDRPEQTRDMTVIYYMTEGEEIDAHVREINRDKARKIDEFMRPLTNDEMLVMPQALTGLYDKYKKYFAELEIYDVKQLI